MILNLLLLAIFAFGSGYAQLTREWVGTGNWGTASNWSPAGNPAGAWLYFTGLGDPSPFNNQTGQTYQRVLFSPAAIMSYAISGNIITLVDNSSGSQGTVEHQSEEQHVFVATLLFNDVGRSGYIVSSNIGRLVLSNVELGASLTSLRVVGSFTDGNITFGGAISGSKPLEIGVDPSGGADYPNTRVIISGSNPSFSGAIRVSSGVLSLQNSGAVGFSTTEFIEIIPGGSAPAAVELQGGISLTTANAKKFIISNQGINLGGAIKSVSGNNSIATDILLASNSRITNDAIGTSLTLSNLGRSGSLGLAPAITFSGNGNITVAGKIGFVGNGALGGIAKTDPGLLTLSDTCNFSASSPVVINTGGKIRIGKSNVFPSSSRLILNDGEFQTGGFSQTFDSLALSFGNGSIVLDSNTAQNVRFAKGSASSLWPFGRTITIYGWSGLAGEPGNPLKGRIFIGSDAAGLTETQLAQINFAGFCNGATLLTSGELVPAKRPFITDVRGSLPYPPANSTLSYAAYKGSTVYILGCRMLDVTQVFIGDSSIIPFGPTPRSDDTLTLTLNDGVRGLITLITPFGTRVSFDSLKNLGYITRIDGPPTGLPWSVDSIWLGGVKPPPNRSATIAHTQILVNSLVDSIKTSIHSDNKLTIVRGQLRLTADNLIPQNTPLELAGGSLRVFNRNTDAANSTIPGHNQRFQSLNLSANSTIVLDSFATRSNWDTLYLGPSNHLNWSSAAVLTIRNWAGTEATPGTRYRIFVGNRDTTLTPRQLRQIRFENRCQGAKLLATGELVPSDAPFLSVITGTPGGVDQAYYGSNISITGCKLDQVDTVRIGNVPIPFFTKTDSTKIDFIYPEGMPDTLVFMATDDIPSKVGFSGSIITKLGYGTDINGNWSNPSTWLGSYIPKNNEKVAVFDTLTVDNHITNVVDSMVIFTVGALDFNNGIFDVTKGLVNNGTIRPSAPGRINLANGAVLTNNTANFNGNGNLTVNLNGNATINGTQPITFFNLILNTGILTLPASNNTATIPFIAGEFRINGGSIVNTAVIPTATVGVRYLSGSKLTYASGTYQRRSREWNNQTNQSNVFGNPFHVEVDNGTYLVLDGAVQPTVNNGHPNLKCDGNFVIRKGTVRADETVPLEIRGDLMIGVDVNSFSTMLMDRLAGEDPNLPTATANNTNNPLRLWGSFIRYANSTFSFRNHRRPVQFLGNTNTTIEIRDAVLVPGDTAMSFYGMVINKNAEITLGIPIGIRDSLNLTSGVINGSTSNFVRIEAAAMVTNGHAGSFVNGQMQKVTSSTPANASADFEFRIGKKIGASYAYKPLRIANLRHSGTTTYSAEYFNESTVTGSFNGPPFLDPILTGIYANQYWMVNKVSGLGKARVGIFYPADPADSWVLSGPEPRSNVAIARYNGSSWEFTKDSKNFNNSLQPYPEVSRDELPAIIYSDTLSTFSPFTLGYGFDGVLPLKLLSFKVIQQAKDGFLEWKIDNAADLGYFEIEHSMDGRTFLPLGRVTSTERKEYSFLHKNLVMGIHYYRLRMVEKDGRFSYSPIEILQIGKTATYIFGLVQNPVSEDRAILKIFSATPQHAEAVVFDMSGRQVMRHRFSLTEGLNRPQMTVQGLSRGQYMLQVRTTDGTIKIIAMLR